MLPLVLELGSPLLAGLTCFPLHSLSPAVGSCQLMEKDKRLMEAS